MLQRRTFKPKLLMENFPVCFEQGKRGLGIDTNLTPTVPPLTSQGLAAAGQAGASGSPLCAAHEPPAPTAPDGMGST